ncbi:hypothetical protein ACFW9O_17780 [Streptomyces sp. NPDC059499]|uniref:hypothetical protein n=1 Tax=Streptomyces sp. NPDC059499 TaxID=3346852 RepID=UPI003698D269
MNRKTLARPRLDGAGWAHPYPLNPFSPVLYADGGEGAPPAPAPDGGAAPGGHQPAGGTGAAPADTGELDLSTLDPRVQKMIADLRGEAGKARTVAKQNAAAEARQELAQDIGKALGLVQDDKATTPEELTQQLRESQQHLGSAQEQAVAAQMELHVYRTAHRLGADADALLDSRSFCDEIDSIDPGDDPKAFNAAVEKAIRGAIQRTPSLRARAGRSGADLSGGSSEQPHSLDKQIAEATQKRDFASVIRLKRQRAAQ